MDREREVVHLVVLEPLLLRGEQGLGLMLQEPAGSVGTRVTSWWLKSVNQGPQGGFEGGIGDIELAGSPAFGSK